MIPDFKLMLIAAGVASFFASLVGVATFRGWALSQNIVDIPNERSSHSEETPRGGGLVVATIVLTAYLSASLILGIRFSLGYLIAAVLVLAISWLDDVYSVKFHWRLLVHLAAATCLVLDTGGLTEVFIPFHGTVLLNPALSVILSVVAIAWFLNAFNFMDGIDGIAGVQSVSASVGWLLISLSLGSPSVAILSIAVLASTLGFLKYNWPPAKIFLGDSGSAFLGFTFAAMPLLIRQETARESGFLPWLAMILVWPFVLDSIITILRRILRREKIWQAHRSHLYQRMVINGLSHRTVSLIYLGSSISLVLPAYLVATRSCCVETVALPAIVLVSGILISAAFLSQRAATK